MYVRYSCDEKLALYELVELYADGEEDPGMNDVKEDFLINSYLNLNSIISRLNLCVHTLVQYWYLRLLFLTLSPIGVTFSSISAANNHAEGPEADSLFANFGMVKNHIDQFIDLVSRPLRGHVVGCLQLSPLIDPGFDGG